jgi:autotransporter-associated beta strand protein
VPTTTYGSAATNLPIVPWLVGDTTGNAGAAGSFNTFISYVADGTGNGPGFVALAPSNFVNTITDGAIATDNVRLANATGSPISVNTGATVNSLLLTTDGGVNGTGVLTIASGAIGVSGIATNVTIANNVSFGAANNREAVITVGIVAGGAGSLTFSGAISTSGGLTKSGGGNLILTASNTYTGPTSIYGSGGNGTLTISSDSNLGTPPANPTPDSIRMNGGNLNVTANATLSANRGLTLFGNGTITTSNTVVYNGAITDNGTGKTLTKSGAGTLILGGAGSSIGSVSILNGAVLLGANNALGANVNLQLGSTTAANVKVLDLANATAPTAAFSQTVSNLSTIASDTSLGNDIITNSFAAGPVVTFTVNNAAANTFGGNVSGKLNLTKSNIGTLTLSGSNSYTGLTTVNSGTLVLTGSNAHNPVLNLGGADIRGGRVILDYTGGGTPVVAVRAALKDSFGTGFATGQIHSGTADAHKGLGFADDGSKVSIAYTFFGDSNLDGMVTSADFVPIALNFNNATQKWTDADFNYDDVVNALDFNAFVTNFGSALPAPVPASLGTLVPEPLSLGGVSILLLSIKRRRKSY